MSQEAKAQLREHADLVDALRNKYAEVDDVQTVTAVEELLEETTRAIQEETMNAEEIIQGAIFTPSPQDLHAHRLLLSSARA